MALTASRKVEGRSHPAAVSIGLPVYNAVDTIGNAMRTLLAQSWTDFELIVSDNASTDGTSEVCSALAAADPRVRYVRQKENIGAVGNFEFVLDAAQGEYFMWAASDDSWHPDFIRRNVAALDADKTLIASISDCVFDGKHLPPEFSGTIPLRGDLGKKIGDFSRSTHANARFYSLFRRSVLVQGPRISGFSYVGGDWAYMLELARIGDFNLDTGIAGFFKSGGGAGSSSKKFKYEGKTLIEYFVPYFRFSSHLWRLVRSEPLATRFVAVSCIVRFNLAGLLEQVRRRNRH